ncbi:glycosyltransferase family 2 protein [Rhizohabitans arisaemae]|uniref:glycosyltransferase family 2 protein n=1 Tax=Rhizohabitans arisaemae TaxID=2720610 RepID=UPI0024B0858B|nr:glycosyltransferase family 2 protein [Rhizohabitans arisaemae]
MTWPAVGVVVPTRGNRPELLRRTLDAISAQDYPGPVRTLVVADRGHPGTVPAEVIENRRSPGLPGARNTGILALGTELVAFCDDDDAWLPGKLTAQVRALRAAHGAEFASCSITVESAGRSVHRLAGRAEVTHADLLRSRMVMVHSSTFLIDRQALIHRIGLPDESIPAGQNEDWDLALRAAKRHPITHVDVPLVRVTWGRTSMFAQVWQDRIAGLEWMLRCHPELSGSRAGAARVYGQLAFHNAALRRRRAAIRWAWRALTTNATERRVPIALAVALGVIPASTVLRMSHMWGRGI